MNFLEIKNLKTFFHTRSGTVRAVDDISLTIRKGEIVGIVGESGSGKSVTCHNMLGLLPQPPARVEGGSIHFHGDDLVNLPQSALRAIREKANFYGLSGSYELLKSIHDNSRADSGTAHYS